MPKEQHIHQLRKKKYRTGQAFFYCIGEECAFKINADVALNKRSLCNRCGKPFNLTQYSLRLAKPHCEDCHKKKNETDVSVPVGFFDSLFPAMPTAEFAGKTADITDEINTGVSLSDRLHSLTKENSSSSEETHDTPNGAIGTRVLYNDDVFTIREYDPNDEED